MGLVDWICRMEACCYLERTSTLMSPHFGTGVIPDERGTVDHIVPLSSPGTPGHTWANVRAAHRLCNREAFSPARRTAPKQS